MKKLFAIILVLVMVVSVSACSTAITEEDKKLVMGTVNGTKYENSFLGIGMNLGEGWTFLTEEEIKELNNLTKDVTDEEFHKYIESAQVFTDMQATGANGADSVIVNIEKAGTLNNAIYSAEDYLENSESEVVAGLESMGYSDIDVSYDKVNIDGTKMDAMYLECNYADMFTIYMVNICFVVDDYIASITVTTLEESDINTIIGSAYII